jgi:hypothetical protein
MEIVMQTFSIAISGLLLFLATAQFTYADDVFILIHPKCSLVPDDLKKTEIGRRSLLSKDRDAKKRYSGFNLDLAWMKFSSGTSPKDVPQEGSSFVLQLLPTKITPVPGVALGRFPGDAVDRQISFTDALLHQPFKLWYVNGPDQAPALLGESTAHLRVSPFELNGMKATLSSEKPADLARRGLVQIYEGELERSIRNSYLPKLMPSKPIPGTAEVKPVPIGTPPVEPFPQYRVSRIRKDNDGNALIEVDLENRLPVWANCFVQRKLTVAEEAAIKGIGGEEARKLATYYRMNISVGPGQKKTAQFVVPSSFVPPTTKFSQVITVEATLSEQSF